MLCPDLRQNKRQKEHLTEGAVTEELQNCKKKKIEPINKVKNGLGDYFTVSGGFSGKTSVKVLSQSQSFRFELQEKKEKKIERLENSF